MTFKEYLEEHFTLKPVSGGRWWRINGECPFCGNKDKMFLSATGGGNCYKCPDGGFGAVKFIMAHKGCTEQEARAILKNNDGDKYVASEEVKEETALWFPSVVPLAGDPLEYAKSRGITPELIRRFGITYCATDTMAAGKVRRTGERLIIPIRNVNNEIVGWTGRTIKKGVEPKYLFPAECGFKAGENLFNIEHVRRDASYMIVAEGVMDVFGWLKAGFNNVFATFGKKISDAQVETLRALNPGVLFIAWDNDAIKEKYHFMERYNYVFKKILFVDLGPNDADELGRDDLLKAIKEASVYSWEDKITRLLK